MIKAYLLFIYNILRIAYNKLRFGRRFSVHWLQRISPRCALKVYGKGRMEIGRNTEIAAGCDIEVHGQGVLAIGEGTYLNRYCMVSAHGSVRIGAHCLFGPGVKIFDNNHRFSKEEGVSTELSIGSVTIGDRCWIASDAVILKGASIGDRCVIGAGCVISGVVPPDTLVKRKDIVETYTIINK